MKRLADRVKAGKVQTVRVTYDSKGRSTVTPLSDWRQITAEDRARWAPLIRAANKAAGRSGAA